MLKGKGLYVHLGLWSVIFSCVTIGLSVLGRDLSSYPNWRLRSDPAVSLLLILPLLGLAFGVVTSVFAKNDLKREAAQPGAESQRLGPKLKLILGIIGAVMPAVYLVVITLSSLSASSVIANLDVMQNDVMDIAARGYKHRLQNKTTPSGTGTYVGFLLPKNMRSNENGTYEIFTKDDTLFIVATSAGYENTGLTAIVDSGGDIVTTNYKGYFSP